MFHFLFRSVETISCMGYRRFCHFQVEIADRGCVTMLNGVSSLNQIINS